MPRATEGEAEVPEICTSGNTSEGRQHDRMIQCVQMSVETELFAPVRAWSLAYDVKGLWLIVAQGVPGLGAFEALRDEDLLFLMLLEPERPDFGPSFNGKDRTDVGILNIAQKLQYFAR